MRRYYEKHILPHAIDFICGLPSFEKGRKKLMPEASGRVLEIGIGTGRNFPYYRPDRLKCFCGIDPGLHRKAERRAKSAGIGIELIPLSAEHIPADDHSFDCVVSTFTLCTIPDAKMALCEVRRVLSPGGRLLFLEHGAALEQNVRNWQNRMTPHWKKVAGGCHLNREIPELIKSAGFQINHMEQDYQPGPRFLTYIYAGAASRD